MQRYSLTETYVTPDGAVMIKQDGHSAWELKETGEQSRAFIQCILEYIRTFHVKAFERLCEEYSKKEPNRLNYEYWIISRFIRCNQGEYDRLSYDIDHSGRLQFEEVCCPLRGECKLENIVCKPEFTSGLSHRETEVLRLIVHHYDTSEIAEKLHLSLHTVNNHRRNIHIKTNTRTIGELVDFWHKNGLK